jgi:hypothetical protein
VFIKIKSQMAAELSVWTFDAATHIRCDGPMFHRASSSLLKKDRTGLRDGGGCCTHTKAFPKVSELITRTENS